MGRVTKPTIRSVAARAGVSLTTVSYVLSGRLGGSTRISKPTQDRVLAAVRELGYVPNQAARGMRTGRTDLIAISVGNLEWPLDRALASSASSMLSELGFQPVVLLGPDAWRQFMLSGGADGVILGHMPDDVTEDRTMIELARRGVPQVVFSEVMQPAGFDVVAPDLTDGLASAMDYLTGRHSRIGTLRRGLESPERSGVTRFGHFQAGMERAGRDVDSALVRTTGHVKAAAYEMALELLSLPEPPTALFCSDDLEALAALRAAGKLGLRVPEDLEIIGVGNSFEGQEAEPALSSVGPGPLVEEVVAMLASRLADGGAPEIGERRLFPWILHHRGTTCP